MTGNRIPPSAEEEARADRIQQIRDELTADFEAGKLRIENGWLVADAGGHTCGTGPNGHYGLHEPGCGWEPIMDLAATFRPLPMDGEFL